jgi:predicted nucleotidyltransferase component of viral defense system
MSAGARRRLWGGESELTDILEGMPGGMGFAVRDFALLTLASQLSSSFPGQLVFKGGFVLRHAHDVLRFSKDVDATRHEPPRQELDSEEVADAIREASIQNVMRFNPDPPATESPRSLDFDHVQVLGDAFPDSSVQVEISYREALVDAPLPMSIGQPFYEDFEVLTMTTNEMAAEKLRTLAQRRRSTDLADLAWLLSKTTTEDEHIAAIAEVKFELVARGRSNRIERINLRLAEMADSYDDEVPGLFPEAPSYREAMEIVGPRLASLVP